MHGHLLVRLPVLISRSVSRRHILASLDAIRLGSVVGSLRSPIPWSMSRFGVSRALRMSNIGLSYNSAQWGVHNVALQPLSSSTFWFSEICCVDLRLQVTCVKVNFSSWHVKTTCSINKYIYIHAPTDNSYFTTPTFCTLKKHSMFTPLHQTSNLLRPTLELGGAKFHTLPIHEARIVSTTVLHT